MKHDLESTKFPNIKKNIFTTLQVNIGYKCNQRCTHCHVDAGPQRWEMMNSFNLALIPRVLEIYNLNILDITGGAPELHPQFRQLVLQTRRLGVEVIDRCNLTILDEPGHEDLAEFLAENKVVITASLPCYDKSNVDNQRGKGVFERSILALKKLNSYGYGKEGNDLMLNLVYNPQGAVLPPPQEKLEEDYRRILSNKYQISFNKLYTITNMPIKRFSAQLEAEGALMNYQKLLINRFNPSNIDNIMCKNIVSVDWQGFLYDCDFNQQLGLKLVQKPQTLVDLVSQRHDFTGQSIKVGQHCFGCTAGAGSSCSGALNKDF